MADLIFRLLGLSKSSFFCSPTLEESAGKLFQDANHAEIVNYQNLAKKFG